MSKIMRGLMNYNPNMNKGVADQSFIQGNNPSSFRKKVDAIEEGEWWDVLEPKMKSRVAELKRMGVPDGEIKATLQRNAPSALAVAGGATAATAAVLAEDEGEDNTEIVSQDMSRQIAADMRNTVAEKVKSEGATDEQVEEELGFVDKFNDSFDLFTLGASLLANNDGNSNVGASLGEALLSSRKAKMRELKGNKTAELDERKVAASELTALSGFMRSKALINAAKDTDLTGVKTTSPDRTNALLLVDRIMGTDYSSKKKRTTEQNLLADTLAKQLEVIRSEPKKLKATADEYGISTDELQTRLMKQYIKSNKLFDESMFLGTRINRDNL